jgi:hypothetical protein
VTAQCRAGARNTKELKSVGTIGNIDELHGDYPAETRSFEAIQSAGSGAAIQVDKQGEDLQSICKC